MAKYTPQELQEAIETLEAAGKTESANVLRKQLQKGFLHVPRNNQDANSKPLGNPLDLAKGFKAGVDKAAYAVADLTPDAPIPDESRDKWNSSLLVKALGLAIPDKEQRQAELAAGKQQAEQTTLGTVGRIGGEIAPAIAGGPATAKLNALKAAAYVQGPLAYATTPGDSTTRAISAALAGLGEGVGRFVPRTIARGAQPIIPNAPAQRFIEQGNFPTPGAAIGPATKKLEESAASMPGVSRFVNRALDQGMADANRLAMERGGLKVSAPGFIGQRELTAQIDKLYGDVLPRIKFDIQDPAFAKGVQQISRKADLTESGEEEINRFIANRLADSGINGTNPNKIFTGKDLQSFLEDIQKRQSEFYGAKGFEGRLYTAYKELNTLVDDLVAKQNPADVVDEYQNVRRIYADTVPAMKAGESSATIGRPSGDQEALTPDLNPGTQEASNPAFRQVSEEIAPEGGIFTPAAYRDALVRNAKSRGRSSALRQGYDRNQQFANDFNTLYGNRYQDSGTASRALITSMALGLGGGYGAYEAGYNPLTGAVGSLAGLTALAAGMYSPSGRKFLLGQKYKWQKPTADLLRKMAPASGTAGAALLPANIEEQ